MPSTTRATPDSSNSSAASAVRMPPPVWTCTDDAVARLDDLLQHGTLVGNAGARRVEVDDVDPARAAFDVARRQLDGVAVALFAVEVALGQPDGGAAAQVDGRVEVHQRRRQVDEVRRATSAPSTPISPGGTARPTTCRGRPGRPPARRSRTPRPSRRPRAARRSGRSTSTVAGPGRATATAPRPFVPLLEAVPLHLWVLDPTGQGVHLAAEDAEALGPGRLDRSLVEELEADAHPEERHAGVDGLTRPTSRGRSRAGPRAHAPNAPTPGSTTASAASTSAGSVTRRAAAPTCCSAFSAERRLPMP